ncbi:hypothetical protein PAAG_12234 [Paracoccidioides lutzii Pb01]|uniref:Uncharacterized protein n=1 Tax=Paracoccidioides lutzii (strain ATCC MYA-826 / Pb01) TaxID=502779 RepID=A0A0A2UZX7_PARBA|nr:hypothetical protein PAAG_12234 [Paracoccidioides lutzii Pb01]KGQ01106.1 hypothetical protein PAAG_12234 [Paracoccidioides lutzii Pb01]
MEPDPAVEGLSWPSMSPSSNDSNKREAPNPIILTVLGLSGDTLPSGGDAAREEPELIGIFEQADICCCPVGIFSTEVLRCRTGDMLTSLAWRRITEVTDRPRF